MKKNNKTAILLLAIGAILAGLGSIDYTESLPNSATRTYKKRNIDKPLRITFHHTAMEGASLHNIAKYHVEKRNFPEIAYHFAIDDEGQLFELNTINEITWHDSGRNSFTIGVVFLGNFHKRELPDKALFKAKQLVDSLSSCLNIVGVDYHGLNSSTACPGKYAIRKLKPLLR